MNKKRLLLAEDDELLAALLNYRLEKRRVRSRPLSRWKRNEGILVYELTRYNC